MSVPMSLHPDRLLPADPGTRSVARRIYATVADLPILSPHSHVPPEWIAEDVPFRDPTSLLITPDHYVNRMLHARGVSLADLGVGQGELSEADSAGPSGCCASTGRPTGAPRCATGWRTSSSTSSA